VEIICCIYVQKAAQGILHWYMA